MVVIWCVCFARGMKDNRMGGGETLNRNSARSLVILERSAFIRVMIVG